MTGYDRWKTTPPEDLVPCSDCGTAVSVDRAPKVDGRPLCPGCHELYDPRLP